MDLEEDLHRRAKGRQDQERDMQKAIVGVLPRSGSDFDALTGLYRMIFAYVMNHFGKRYPSLSLFLVLNATHIFHHRLGA